MLSIGNDIVDLNLAKIQSNWQRPGFLEKQFSQKERAIILNSENPFLQVWLFWSMKEAAYKCHVQQFQKRFFAPKKIACKMISKTEGIATINTAVYILNIKISNSYIHTIATKETNFKMVSELFFIDKNTSQTKIIDDNLLSFFSNETSIKKNEIGIPFLYKDDSKLPISISKSHHGNYGGFAILYCE